MGAVIRERISRPVRDQLRSLLRQGEKEVADIMDGGAIFVIDLAVAIALEANIQCVAGRTGRADDILVRLETFRMETAFRSVERQGMGAYDRRSSSCRAAGELIDIAAFPRRWI
jgi:hypothetical protein